MNFYFILLGNTQYIHSTQCSHRVWTLSSHSSLNICPSIIELYTCPGLSDTSLSICCLQSWWKKGGKLHFMHIIILFLKMICSGFLSCVWFKLIEEKPEVFWRRVVATETLFPPLHPREGKTCPRAHPEVADWPSICNIQNIWSAMIVWITKGQIHPPSLCKVFFLQVYLF